MGQNTSSSTITHFKVINNTNRDIVNTDIFEVENHHWNPNLNPEVTLVGHHIKGEGHSIQGRVEIKPNISHAPFGMLLLFSDGSKDYFRVHQMYALKKCCNNHFEHIEQSHNIYFRRVGNDTLLVDIQNTSNQLENERAEKHNKRGEQAMSEKWYEKAVQEFKNAKSLANEASTIDKIRENLKKAESANEANRLNNEGMQLMRDGHYDSAVIEFNKALKVAVNSMTREIMNNRNMAFNARAEQLNREGVEAFKKGDYEFAVQKFKEAHTLSYEKSTVDITQRNLIKAARVHSAMQKNKEGNQLLRERKFEPAITKFKEALELSEGSPVWLTINNNKLKALEQYGMDLYYKGWLSENNEYVDRSAEAEENFKKSKEIFTELNLRHHLQLVDLKIAGNVLFNEGANLEQESSALYKKAQRTRMAADFAAARIKYEEVLNKYVDAKKKFEEGSASDELFSNGTDYVNSQIQAVRKRIEEINEVVLKMQVQKVTFDEIKNQGDDEVSNLENVNIVSDATSHDSVN